MNKKDKEAREQTKRDMDWVRAKIFQIIDTPTAELLGDDPRDKRVAKRHKDNHVLDSMRLTQGPREKIDGSKLGPLKREKYSHEDQQMQLFAKYLADELKKRGFDQKNTKND